MIQNQTNNSLRVLTAKIAFLLSVSFIALISAAQASGQALSKELDSYITVFSGNNFAEQRKAIEPLGWSGITSPKLYDVIADKLLMLKDADSKVDKERASWFAKSLALSGNEKYADVLQEVIDTSSVKKIKKHAKIALERLPRYQNWNPVIAQGLANTSESLAIKRIKNMLAADDPALFRLGAKRVYHAHASNTELVGLVKQNLMANYQNASSKDDIDAMSWAIKVLAQSGDSAHAGAIKQIASDAKQKKIRKYAKKYLDYF